MKGVILGIAPEAQIVDISHAVQPFDILDGALTISQAYSYFPSETVHMVIVDPGVGTARRPVILTADRHRFVAPDNGVLSLIYDREERISVRHITAEHYFLQPVSQTFHGRDIFSPVGAHVARGEDWTKVGPEMPVASLVRLELKAARIEERGATAEVIATDGPFGNLVTNLDAEDFLKLGYQRGQDVPVKVGEKEMKIKFVRTFSDVPVGEPLLYIDSRGHLGLAVNQRSFSAIYGVKPPADLFIARAK